MQIGGFKRGGVLSSLMKIDFAIHYTASDLAFSLGNVIDLSEAGYHKSGWALGATVPFLRPILGEFVTAPWGPYSGYLRKRLDELTLAGFLKKVQKPHVYSYYSTTSAQAEKFLLGKGTLYLTPQENRIAHEVVKGIVQHYATNYTETKNEIHRAYDCWLVSNTLARMVVRAMPLTPKT
jgi:hypothetical protein